MPIKKHAKKEEVKKEEVLIPLVSEKEHLLALYQELKDRRINSISDLENDIAKCQS